MGVRLPTSRFSTAMGFHVPLLFVVLAHFQVLLATQMSPMVWLRGRLLEPQRVMNLLLLCLLGLSYTVWIWHVARQRIGTWSGAGFTLAAFGLYARAWAETLTGLPARWPPVGRGWDEALTWIARSRDLGLIGYCMGLTFVLVACLSDARVAKATPWWARFME